jgi:hypothetical protein
VLATLYINQLRQLNGFAANSVEGVRGMLDYAVANSRVALPANATYKTNLLAVNSVYECGLFATAENRGVVYPVPAHGNLAHACVNMFRLNPVALLNMMRYGDLMVLGAVVSVDNKLYCTMEFALTCAFVDANYNPNNIHGTHFDTSSKCDSLGPATFNLRTIPDC